MEKLLSVEVANLPPSAITRLGMFLLACGLQIKAAQNGEGESIALAFAKQTEDKVKEDYTTLRGYGFKPSQLQAYENPKVLQGFARDIGNNVKKIINDPAVSVEEVRFTKFAALFLENPDKLPNYMDRARNFAVQVSGGFLRNFDKVSHKINGTVPVAIGASSKDVADYYGSIRAIVKTITGKPGLSIANDKVKAMRVGKNADLIREYKAARRKLSSKYDMDLATFLSNAGNDGIVPIQDAYKFMDNLGYETQKIPNLSAKAPLRIGMQNGKIKYYTGDSKPLLTGIPANAEKVTFPSTYDSKTGKGAYISYKTPEAVGITRVYTEQHATAATNKKFTAAESVDTKIDKVLLRWKKDMMADDWLTRMGSTAAILIYLTGMRVGSRQKTAASATGVMTYGAISLRPRHVSVRPTGITIKYSGKKSVEQKHLIKVNDTLSKLLAKNLAVLVKDKRGDSLVFTHENDKGKEITLTYAAFVKYLTTSGYPGGIHKIRHVRGTNMVMDLLSKNTFKPSAKANTNLTQRQKEAEAFIISKVLTPAAVLLGHKSGTDKVLWRTTIKSYINPAVLVKWFTDNNLRQPNWLPSKLSSADE